ncbi:hypothetical protein T10_10081 [Trichinella papuae]|uniref:Uncharacterized protein n=1 Tax=Trichinella papuae TaxID=268474 RepID=A0A0V1MR16_9BILA|nr:hypothetical protein T10_10081 [Trichinella papuae]
MPSLRHTCTKMDESKDDFGRKYYKETINVRSAQGGWHQTVYTRKTENCADTIINKCYELKLMIAVKTGSVQDILQYYKQNLRITTTDVAGTYSNRTICPGSLVVVPVGNMEFEKREFGQADESTFVNLHQHL